MSDDIKVNLLLKEVKDDPRFLELTSNTAKATFAQIANDPLLSSISGGVTPFLFSVSDNVPNIFDVKLDLFQILKIDLDVNIVKVTDVVTKVFGKNLNENLSTSDRYTYFLSTLKTDVFSATSSEKLAITKRTEDKAKLKEEIDVILGGKTLLDSIKINSREIKKKVNFFFYRRQVGEAFNLVKLAESTARPGLSVFNGASAVGTPPKKYLLSNGTTLFASGVASDQSFGITLTDSRYVKSDFRGTGDVQRPTFFSSNFDSLTWGGPYPNHGQLPTEAPQLSRAANSDFLNSSSFRFSYLEYPIYPVYHNLQTGRKGMLLPRGGPEETDTTYTSVGTLLSLDINRLTFWWEPGYKDEYTGWNSDRVNKGNLIITHPAWITEASSGTGVGSMSTLKEVQTGTFSSGAPVLAGYYEETIQGPFGPALIPVETGFDAVRVVDKLISIIRRRFIGLENQVTLLDKLIRPAKSRVASDRLRASIKVTKKQTIELQEQLMQTIMELHPHKITKGLVEKPTARQSILTAKGRIEKDTLVAEIEQKLDVGINVYVEGITIANNKFKKVTQRKIDNVKVRSNLLTKPAFPRNLKDDVHIKDLKKIKTAKDLKIKLESIEQIAKGPGKRESLKGTARDTFILPNKAKLKIDKYLANEKLKLKFGLNTIKEQQSETIERIQKGPNKGRSSKAGVNQQIILSGKSRIASDRAVLLDILKFDPNFKLFQSAETDAGHKEFIVNKQAKTLVAALIDTIPLIARAELPISTLTVTSKDRDESGTGDVFFTFKFSIRKDSVDLNDTVRFLTVNKLAAPTVFTGRDNTLVGKARIQMEKVSTLEGIDSFTVGKNIFLDKLIFEEDHLFGVGKPITNIIPLKEVLLNPKAEFVIDRFRVLENVHDILLKRGLTNKFSTKESSKKLIHKQGIQNAISASIKGNLFIRDEEYVTGTYFLEPYVATIPPGRSRQF